MSRIDRSRFQNFEVRLRASTRIVNDGHAVPTCGEPRGEGGSCRRGADEAASFVPVEHSDIRFGSRFQRNRCRIGSGRPREIAASGFGGGPKRGGTLSGGGLRAARHPWRRGALHDARFKKSALKVRGPEFPRSVLRFSRLKAAGPQPCFPIDPDVAQDPRRTNGRLAGNEPCLRGERAPCGIKISR